MAGAQPRAQRNLESLLGTAHNVLRDVFGLSDFRGVQKAAISAVFEGKDALVLMPTGAGKSLCYALPAAVLQGLVLVVSPLIALMQDQVAAMRAKGLRVDFLSSTRTEAERRAVLSSLAAASKLHVGSALPDGALLQLLYVTPELISKNEGFMEIMSRLHAAGRLALLAIDEAHCISSWGHDFRPAYRQLSSLRRRLPKTPVLALTATASHKVRDDVVASLALRSPAILAMSFNRPNVHYSVEYVDLLAGPSQPLAAMRDAPADARVPTLETAEAAAYSRLLDLVRQEHTDEQQNQQEQHVHDRGNSGRFASCSGATFSTARSVPGTMQTPPSHQWQAPCAVVYVLKRTTADALSARLVRDGVPAAAYHAKMTATNRERVLQEWQSGHVRVVCATTAFGMGIDKADVRLVVHWDLPKTMEGLYQESGRAGRDGRPSRSVVMYTSADRRRMDFILQKEAERSSSRKRNRSQHAVQASPSAAADSSSHRRPAAAFGEVVEYCTAAHCRRAFMLKHFGEVLQRGRPAGMGAGGPGSSGSSRNRSSGDGGHCCCDHCADSAGVVAAAAQLKEVEQEVSMRFAGAWQSRSTGSTGARGGGDDSSMFGGWGAGSSDEAGSDAAGSSGSDAELDEAALAANAAMVAAAKGTGTKRAGSFMDAMLAAEQAHEEGAGTAAAAQGAEGVEGLLAKRTAAPVSTKPKEIDAQMRAVVRQRLASILAANPNLAMQSAGKQGTCSSGSAAAAPAAVLGEALERQLYEPGMSVLQYRGAVAAAAKALQQSRTLLDVPDVQELGGSPDAVAVVLQGVLSELARAHHGGVAATAAAVTTAGGSMSSAPHQEAGCNTDVALAARLLQGLAKLPVSVQALEQTGAAKQVRALRKHGDPAVAAAANDTVYAWRARVAAAVSTTTKPR